MDEHRDRRITITLALAYLITLALMVAGSYFPHLRAWGIAPWAFLNIWVPLASAAAAIIALIGILRLRSTEATGPVGTSRPFVSLAAVVLAGIAFTIFRTETHFLGDGYPGLSLLAADNPLVKEREIGESMLHIWVKGIFGADEEAALTSFRVLSIGAGVLFATAVMVFARRLYYTWAERLLFALTLCTGGYMLLFFGYVENYSIFVMSVGLFVLTGIAAARGLCARWWILLPLALATVMHIMGVTLLLAALYLLLAPTRLGRQVARLSPTTKLISLLVLAAAGLAAITIFEERSLFFKFALLPLTEDRWTVDNYTLFAPAHLIDLANLLLLLVPGLGVGAAVVLATRQKKIWKDADSRFLAVTLLSTLCAIFLFDPKLGMGRDWDLFSFVGVPLAALVALVVLRLPLDRRRVIHTLAAVILLGLFSLAGRLTIVNTPDAAVAQFSNFLDMDFGRGVNSRVILIAYYDNRGDTATGDSIHAQWFRDFPESKMLQDAKAMKEAGHKDEARKMFYRIIEMNPRLAGSWSNLGEMYLAGKQYDSALVHLQTALGLNPYEAAAWANLGLLHFNRGEFDKALECLEGAYSIQPTQAAIPYNLAHVYRALKNWDKFEEYMRYCTMLPDAPLSSLQLLGDYYLSRQRFQDAGEVFRRAIERGFPESAVAERIKQFPALAREIQK